MRIAIISDTHFGYTRFEEDAFKQAEAAFFDAAKKADLIIYSGDVFDSKIPKLETINRAAEMLKKVNKPIYAIHGNHERRSKGMVNALQLLATMGVLKYIHNEAVSFEKDGEQILVFGLGNMPEEYIKIAIDNLIGHFKVDKKATNFLVIHQSIRDFILEEEGLSIEELEELPFDVIVNGHIHQTLIKMNGRLLIPGSTVLTQLRKDESARKGYIIYDTKTKSAELVPINSRQFFYEELLFNGEKASEVKQVIETKIGELKKKAEKPIIKIKIKGRIEGDLDIGSLLIDGDDTVYLDNELVGASLKEKLNHIKSFKGEGASIKDKYERLFIERSKEKISLFEPREMFEYLLSSSDEAFDYLIEKIRVTHEGEPRSSCGDTRKYGREC